MAYPPVRITVKRRRDEDPVEALFIQQKKQRPSGFWKLVDGANDAPEYAVPTASRNAVRPTQTSTTAFNVSKPPTVRTTSPSEDSNEQWSAIPRSSEDTKPGTDVSATAEERQLLSESTQAKKSRQNTHDVFASALKARKFHLVKNPSPTPSPFLVPKTIAQKHRDRRKKDLAIFVERSEITRKGQHSGDYSRHSNDEPRQVESVNKNDMSQLEKPRKRPNATAAERKWRTETWTNPPKPNEVHGNVTKTAESIIEPSSRWNYESNGLAEQLQAVALEEIRASELRAKELNCSGHLKVKPKPPKRHRPRREDLVVDDGGDDVMKDTINIDHEDDYVLDTYIRSGAKPSASEVTEPAGLRHDPLHGIDHSNIGILVIEDDDEEALWEAFAEDQESDPDWDSEEEDENAEDYYGNDYPEDEITSDDEFGRGAYNNHYAASDDEEFGPSDGE